MGQTLKGELRVQAEGLPGGPVVRAPHFHCRGPTLDPLVGKIRSPKPHGTAKTKKDTGK